MTNSNEIFWGLDVTKKSLPIFIGFPSYRELSLVALIFRRICEVLPESQMQ